jgi:hypothetical protein
LSGISSHVRDRLALCCVDAEEKTPVTLRWKRAESAGEEKSVKSPKPDPAVPANLEPA